MKKKKRHHGRSAKLSPAFKARWIELTGKKAPKKFQPLMMSIATLRGVQLSPIAFANPEIYVFVFKEEGTGCAKRAQIRGFYEKSLGPNDQCIGEAAVKAILDSAAKATCRDKLECPEICPCIYTPQAALATYDCRPGFMERGYLIGSEEVWNCNCKMEL